MSTLFKPKTYNETTVIALLDYDEMKAIKDGLMKDRSQQSFNRGGFRQEVINRFTVMKCLNDLRKKGYSFSFELVGNRLIVEATYLFKFIIIKGRPQINSFKVESTIIFDDKEKEFLLSCGDESMLEIRLPEAFMEMYQRDQGNSWYNCGIGSYGK